MNRVIYFLLFSIYSVGCGDGSGQNSKRVKTLEQQVESLESQEQKNQTEIDKKQERISDLEESVQNEKIESKKLKEELERNKRQLSLVSENGSGELAEKIADLQAKLEASDNRIKEFQNKINELKNSRSGTEQGDAVLTALLGDLKGLWTLQNPLGQSGCEVILELDYDGYQYATLCGEEGAQKGMSAQGIFQNFFKREINGNAEELAPHRKLLAKRESQTCDANKFSDLEYIQWTEHAKEFVDMELKGGTRIEGLRVGDDSNNTRLCSQILEYAPRDGLKKVEAACRLFQDGKSGNWQCL